MDEESPSELLQRLNTDAVLWAKEFMLLFGENRDNIDEGLMIGWFANSIMAGFKEGISSVKNE